MFVQDLIQRGRKEDLAILDDGREITYQMMQESVAAYRDYLHKMGVRPHDHVALFSRNSADYIFAYMSIVSLGAVAVPINFQLSMREVAYILKDAGIHHILTYKRLDLKDALAAQHYLEPVTQHDISFWEHSSTPAPAALPENFTAEEPCTIIYTSGTTGSPKGAVLTHKNLTRNSEMVEQVLHVKPGDNVLCVLPMYHCFAWTCAVLNALYSGACITIIDTFTPKETIDIIRTKKISVIYAVPSICSLISKLGKKEDLVSLHTIVLGGTTLPVQIAKDFTTKFGLSIEEGYGLSEASPVVTLNPRDKIKVGSIGLPLPGVDLRIIDASGNEVPVGEAGELLVKGDNVMPGYWNLPEATAKAIQDGWLHTGDVARQDEDGYIYIVDRIKDLIISMGENIYPREIEELIYAYPGIAEAAVIGVEDRLRGAAGCCFYSLHEGEDLRIREMKKYLQQNLALYKIPREFHELPELPKTSTGKIAKRELLKIYLELKAAAKAKK